MPNLPRDKNLKSCISVYLLLPDGTTSSVVQSMGKRTYVCKRLTKRLSQLIPEQKYYRHHDIHKATDASCLYHSIVGIVGANRVSLEP